MSEQQYTPETDPQHNLRSDLWPTMSASQLARQQEIAIDKMSRLNSMMGAGAPQSLLGIYSALQQALKDLNALINNRSIQQ